MPLTSRCSRRCCDGCRGEDFEIQERGPLPGQGQGWTCYARGWSSVWAERVLSRKALPALRRFPAVLGLHHVREARPGRSLNCHCRSDDMWYCTQQRLPMSFQDKKLEYLRRNSKPLVPPGWMKPTIAAPIPTPPDSTKSFEGATRTKASNSGSQTTQGQRCKEYLLYTLHHLSEGAVAKASKRVAAGSSASGWWSLGAGAWKGRPSDSFTLS